MFQVRTENNYRSPKRIFVLPQIKNSLMTQNQPATILASPRSCFSDHPPKNIGFFSTSGNQSKIEGTHFPTQTTGLFSPRNRTTRIFHT